MMMRKYFYVALLILISVSSIYAVENSVGKIEDTFYAERAALNQELSKAIYEDPRSLYSMKRDEFNKIIESYRQKYMNHVEDYTARHQYSIESPAWAKERKEIHYFFDKLLLDYSIFHEQYTGVAAPPDTRLEKNKEDFNDPALLDVDSYAAYLKAWLYYQSKAELAKEEYENMDNKQLRAALALIDENFTDNAVVDTLKFQYLMDYMDRYGIKNIGDLIEYYSMTCQNEEYKEKVNEMFLMEERGREEHHVEFYKRVGCYELDMHLFFPVDMPEGEKRPVIIYFHGGSWSEGKPDWDFNACRYYADQGWVAATVEYRIADRHGSLPMESVMDAKSAVRWIRENAEAFNIDTEKVVVAGNSAGGHLAMMTAMDEALNEAGEDTSVSAVPNAVMVNSGVFDLTDEGSWIRRGLRERGLDEGLVTTISPVYIVRKDMPPMLIIHGTEDRNVPFETATAFVKKMKKAKNNIEFHAIEGANHYIWYGEFGGEVWKIRQEFIRSLGF